MKRHLLSLVAGSLLAFSAPVLCDTFSEKESLQRLSWEIHAMEQILQEAERRADPSARYPFRYDFLRQDLLTVRHGIEAYISMPQDEPPALGKLRGDYRR